MHLSFRVKLLRKRHGFLRTMSNFHKCRSITKHLKKIHKIGCLKQKKLWNGQINNLIGPRLDFTHGTGCRGLNAWVHTTNWSQPLTPRPASWVICEAGSDWLSSVFQPMSVRLRYQTLPSYQLIDDWTFLSCLVVSSSGSIYVKQNEVEHFYLCWG